MRKPRIKLDGEGFYHVTTRCVDKDFKFNNADKAAIEAEMRRISVFCGAEVCTYAIMSNHLHLLVRILPAVKLDDDELLRRIGALYGPQRERETRRRWADIREGGSVAELAVLATEQETLVRRMGDLSNFMKELKQRISRTYNRSRGREGTLWEGRFRSVLLEDAAATLQAVAAYIDLNAVRANIVQRPEDYRWCGYARALAGDEMAVTGLSAIYRRTPVADDFQLIAKCHAAAMEGALARDRAKAEQLLERVGGDRLLALAVRQRNAYFTRSLAIGGVEFIRRVHRDFSDRFGRICTPRPYDIGILAAKGAGLHASHRLRAPAA